LTRRVSIDKREVESKLGFELILPLLSEPGGAEYKNSTDPAAADELTEYQPSLDRFTESNVVKKSEGNPWHSKGFGKWNQLIIFNLNTTQKWRDNR
jgi:hypothetical protein